MKTISILDATAPGVVIGRHSIWAPELGVKVPFEWGGKITKYGKNEPGYEPADTLPHEIAILRALSERGMAPPLGELVFVETLITQHRGAWHADPVGAWGYEMADAEKLPPGKVVGDVLEGLRERVDNFWEHSADNPYKLPNPLAGLPIVSSLGAHFDLLKKGNIVNGYIVDMRRSAPDMHRWKGPLPILPPRPGNAFALADRVHRDCQFPAGERDQAYQDFWIDGRLERGQRRVIERARELGFDPQPGDTLLDIGCQAGGFLQFAAASGATAVGVEINPTYIDCARALARSCGQNICIREMDVVRDRAAFLAWVRAYFPKGVDHVLCLSMEKHLGERFLFELLDAIGARHTYIETNAVSDKNPMKLWPFVEARGGRHVGDSNDRNLRRLYRMDRSNANAV